jgi:predicted site-specific integrase-resolvase
VVSDIPAYLTPKSLSRLFDVSVATVHRWIKTGNHYRVLLKLRCNKVAMSDD